MTGYNGLERFKLIHGDVERLRDNVWLYRNTTTHKIEHYTSNDERETVECVAQYDRIIGINKEIGRIVGEEKENIVINSMYGNVIYRGNIQQCSIMYNRYLAIKDITIFKLMDIMDGAEVINRSCIEATEVEFYIKDIDIHMLRIVYVGGTIYNEYIILEEDKAVCIDVQGYGIGVVKEGSNEYIVVFTDKYTGVIYDVRGSRLGEYSNVDEERLLVGGIYKGIIKIDSYIKDVVCKVMQMYSTYK